MKNNEYKEYKSGRQAVFDFLSENKYLSFGSIRQKLVKHTAFGDLKDQTIRNYMSAWNIQYSKLGKVPKFHRGLGILESGFDDGLWDKAPNFNWQISHNRNRERLRSKCGISLGWHRNGTVVFRFKGFRPQGHLLTAFIQSFLDVVIASGLNEIEAINYLQALFKEYYRTISFHSTIETGQILPKTKINDFKKSHGIIIKLGDGSHPTAVEIEQTEPFWFNKIEEIIDNLGIQIDSHLNLIKLWREESVENKRALTELIQSLKLNCTITKLASKLFDFFHQIEKGEKTNE